MIPPEPAAAPLTFDHQPALKCPFCPSEYVHIELVHVGARREDQPPYLITVDAIAGQVRENPAYEARSSRRQWVELVVNCEGCDGGSIVLAQHKGQTLVNLNSGRPTGGGA